MAPEVSFILGFVTGLVFFMFIHKMINDAATHAVKKKDEEDDDHDDADWWKKT